MATPAPRSVLYPVNTPAVPARQVRRADARRPLGRAVAPPPAAVLTRAGVYRGPGRDARVRHAGDGQAAGRDAADARQQLVCRRASLAFGRERSPAPALQRRQRPPGHRDQGCQAVRLAARATQKHARCCVPDASTAAPLPSAPLPRPPPLLSWSCCTPTWPTRRTATRPSRRAQRARAALHKRCRRMWAPAFAMRAHHALHPAEARVRLAREPGPAHEPVEHGV